MILQIIRKSDGVPIVQYANAIEIVQEGEAFSVVYGDYRRSDSYANSEYGFKALYND